MVKLFCGAMYSGKSESLVRDMRYKNCTKTMQTCIKFDNLL